MPKSVLAAMMAESRHQRAEQQFVSVTKSSVWLCETCFRVLDAEQPEVLHDCETQLSEYRFLHFGPSLARNQEGKCQYIKYDTGRCTFNISMAPYFKLLILTHCRW